MAYFKPIPESLTDLDHTPRFYCQLCGADMFVVQISERKVAGGVLRELECPNCRCVERVGIRLSEDFSGWILFQAEEPFPASDTNNPHPLDKEN